MTSEINPIEQFNQECDEEIRKMGEDEEFSRLSRTWLLASAEYKYGYHFSWMGRPIIQLPTDMVMMQELIWRIKPDVIVETGIAHGGSLVFYASMLVLLDIAERGGGGEERRVIGIDIDIRAHNRKEIENHPLYSRIVLLEGSSTDKEIAEKVHERTQGKTTMVCLDSHHTHEHVLSELRLYAPLVSVGSYAVVFDTGVEFAPKPANRPWGPGNNPYTAVQAFLNETDGFEADRTIDAKLQISAAPGGYLRRVR